MKNQIFNHQLIIIFQIVAAKVINRPGVAVNNPMTTNMNEVVGGVYGSNSNLNNGSKINVDSK